MRIDDNKFNQTAQLAAGSTAQGADTAAVQTKTQRTGGGGPRDFVAVSDLSNVLTQLASLADADRAEVVNRVATQYRSGAYVVDNAALGASLITGAFER